jgi:hypothetical protein
MHEGLEEPTEEGVGGGDGLLARGWWYTVSQHDDGDWVYNGFFTLLIGLAGRPSSHHPYRWVTSSISSQYGTNSVLLHIATTFEYWFYAIKM